MAKNANSAVSAFMVFIIVSIPLGGDRLFEVLSKGS